MHTETTYNVGAHTRDASPPSRFDMETAMSAKPASLSPPLPPSHEPARAAAVAKILAVPLGELVVRLTGYRPTDEELAAYVTEEEKRLLARA